MAHPQVMQRIPLKSSAVRAAGYDAQTQTLEIEFQGGRIYRYDDVPEAVFEWLCRTPKKGSYVTRVIDSKYQSREVTPTPPAQDLLAALEASLRASKSEDDST